MIKPSVHSATRFYRAPPMAAPLRPCLQTVMSSGARSESKLAFGAFETRGCVK
jgi:hypothetical protein